MQEPVIIDSTTDQVGRYNVTDAAIQKMKDEFLPLKIKGLEDKETFKMVFESRQVVKKTITGIEKKRKELKAPVLKDAADIDTEAARITKELEFIKDHLQNEEDEYNRLKNEEKIKEEKLKEILVKARVAMLIANGMTFDGISYSLSLEQILPGDPESISISFADINLINDESFLDFMVIFKSAFNAQQSKKQAEVQRVTNEMETLKVTNAELLEKNKVLETKIDDYSIPVPELGLIPRVMGGLKSIIKPVVSPPENKTSKSIVPYGLNYENFWTEITAKYPNSVKKFGEWIDEYKITVGWNKLFWQDPYGPKQGGIKYHDLPLAMQIGIFIQYFVQTSHNYNVDFQCHFGMSDYVKTMKEFFEKTN